MPRRAEGVSLALERDPGHWVWILGGGWKGSRYEGTVSVKTEGTPGCVCVCVSLCVCICMCACKCLTGSVTISLWD